MSEIQFLNSEAGIRQDFHSDFSGLCFSRISVCQKIYPIWEQYFSDSDIAGRALKGAKDYAEDRMDAESAWKLANTLSGGLDNAGHLTDPELNAFLAGQACCDLLYLSFLDAACDEEDMQDQDQELDCWDYSMYAAGTYSGGFPFVPEPYHSDPSKLKEFWTWYIETALP